MTIALRAAALPQDLPVIRELLREYAASLGIDLCFQDFDAELAQLPGKYARPAGAIVLAWDGDTAVGCVALRPVAQSVCEMKRLYVRPQMRALQLGRRLVERICDEARDAGYRRICLDTLPCMTSAIRLYGALGFAPIAPYVYNPIDGVLFLGREL